MYFLWIQIGLTLLPGVSAWAKPLFEIDLAACNSELQSLASRHWLAVRDRNKVTPLPNKSLRWHQNNLAQPALQFQSQILVTETLGDQTGRKRSLNIFPSIFHPVDLHSFSEGWAREGLRDDAFIFGLFIPPETNLEFAKPKLLSHLPGSFAYLRFYIENHQIMVVEIQSDVYGRLKRESPERELYRDWSRVLLLAFENYVRMHLLPNLKQNRVTLYIADPLYQNERWQSFSKTDPSILEDRISPELTRILYRDLPKNSGYQLQNIENLKIAPEWPEHRYPDESLLFEFAEDIPKTNHPNQDGSKNILIKNAWAKEISISNPVTGLEALFGQKLKRVYQTSLADDISDRVAALTPTHASRLTEAIGASGLVAVPSIGVAEIPSALERQVNTILGRHSEIANQAEWSLGPYSKMPSQIIEILGDPLPARGVHLGLHQRHPFIWWMDPAHHVWALSTKGGGRSGGAEYLHEGYSLDDPSSKIWLPVVDMTEGKEGSLPLVQSHHQWGGLSLDEAKTEFENTVSLHALWQESYRKSAPASFPLSIRVPTEIPTYHPSSPDVQFWNARDYYEKFSPNTQNPLVQIKFLSQSQIRIVDLILALKEKNSPPEIQNLVRLLYRANHEPFYALNELDLSHWGEDPCSKWTGCMKFLNAIYQKNSASADRIYARVLDQGIKTLGLVHGAGGTLGGTASQYFDGPHGEVTSTLTPIGSPNGGAPAIRNFSIAGEFMDLDGEMYFPWLRSSRFDSVVKDNIANLEAMQTQDLKYWQETLYWLMNLLKGRAHPQADYITNPFSFAQSFIVVPEGLDTDREEKDYAILIEEKLRKRLKDPTLVFRDLRHVDLYRESQRKGKSFRTRQLRKVSRPDEGLNLRPFDE